MADLHRWRQVPDLVARRPGTVLQESGQPDHGGDLHAKADSFAADKAHLWSSKEILDPGPGAQWSLDLAPDGKRFAVFPRPDATGEQKGSVHVTVLLNFFDELRRRVPVGGK